MKALILRFSGEALAIVQNLRLTNDDMNKTQIIIWDPPISINCSIKMTKSTIKSYFCTYFIKRHSKIRICMRLINETAVERRKFRR